MNKMEEFAKRLGKELDEEFLVKVKEDYCYKCKITNEGLLAYVPALQGWIEHNNLLDDLISGKHEIKSLPWKVTNEAKFYVPAPITRELYYKKITGIESPYDNLITYERGFMCKTQEQAVELARLLIKTARKFQGFDGEKAVWENE